MHGGDRIGFLEVLLGILAVLGVLSPLLFNKRGVITRRTILLTSALFGAFVILLEVYVMIRQSSAALVTALCLGALSVAYGAYLASLYVGLPRIRNWVDRRR
jgi:hypothetical protein